MDTPNEIKKEAEPNMVELAIKTAERIEKANAENKELLARMEKLEAFKALGGRTETSQQQNKPIEISSKDYAKNLLSGRLN